MKKLLFILIIVIVAVSLYGCGGDSARKQIENAIAVQLPDIIGPAESYAVDVSASPIDLFNGRIKSIDIVGVNVTTLTGLKISNLQADVQGVRFSRSSREITKVSSTTYKASVIESELEKIIRDKYPDIPELRLSIKGDKLLITAAPGLANIRANISTEAEVYVEEQKMLRLKLHNIKAVGISAPNFARDFFEKRLGNIFNVDDLGFPATIDSAELGFGMLTLSGSVDLMSIINRPKINSNNN
ncbi:MAG: DUF2993 domain-containing protein [Armatimonadota bacterium]